MNGVHLRHSNHMNPNILLFLFLGRSVNVNVGIDLLWLKVGKIGGGESYIRNLLDGFYKYATKGEYKFFLFLAKDNHHTFDKYFDKENFIKIIMPIQSKNVAIRIIKENLLLDKYAKDNNIDLMFVPVYSKPLFKNKKIPYIITIHDLQALHYPEYFSKIKNLWLKYAWKRCAITADRIIAISNFVKKDIEDKLEIATNKIEVIYNPITNLENFEDFDKIKSKYNIKENNYYYTISALLPHKNLKTLILVMKKLKEENNEFDKKLVITGVDGKSKTEINQLIHDLNLNKEVVFTGFISNEERNSLYKNAKIFLFPSIFEGFGMPPVEAMMLGTPVITTKLTSIYEVTQGKAYYVEDPYNVDEWAELIKYLNENSNHTKETFKEYELKNITNQYLNLFKEMVNNK